MALLQQLLSKPTRMEFCPRESPAFRHFPTLIPLQKGKGQPQLLSGEDCNRFGLAKAEAQATAATSTPEPLETRKDPRSEIAGSDESQDFEEVLVVVKVNQYALRLVGANIVTVTSTEYTCVFVLHFSSV